MKDRHPYSPYAVVPAKGRRQQQRPRQFNKKRSFQDKTGKSHDTAHRRRRDRILHGAALLQRDISPGEHKEGNGKGDNAQPSDLDQQQNNRLAEYRPVASGIQNHQSGNANCGSGGKQRLGKRRPLPCRRRNRQHKHQRPQQNDTRKPQDHHLK